MVVFPLLGISGEESVAGSMRPAALLDLSILLFFGAVWLATLAILRSRKKLRVNGPAQRGIG